MNTVHRWQNMTHPLESLKRNKNVKASDGLVSPPTASKLPASYLRSL